MILNILKCPHCHQIAMIYKDALVPGDVIESSKCLFPKVGYGERCVCSTCGHQLVLIHSNWLTLDLSDYFMS